MRPLTLPRKGILPASSFRDEWRHAAYILTDLFFIVLNGAVVFYARFAEALLTELFEGRKPELYPSLPLQEYLGFFFLYAIVIILFLENHRHYHFLNNRSAAEEAVGVSRAVLFSTLLMAAVIYLSGSKSVSRLVVGFTGVLNMITLVLWRLWRRQIVERKVARGEAPRKVLIVGSGQDGKRLADYFSSNRQLGIAVAGFIDSGASPDSSVLGTVDDLADIARSKFIDEIYITSTLDHDTIRRAATVARMNRIGVRVVPDLIDGLGWGAPIEHVGDVPVFSVHREPIPVLGLLVKRGMDIVGSLAALIVLSPLIALVAAAIRLDSPGPVIYRSRRMGRKGRAIWCHKFRTMVADADDHKEDLRDRNERKGPTFKIENDPRITRVGRFLRKSSLDEIPQFWDVLRGDMSLVGPRPHPLDDYEQYSLAHLRRLDVMPGITGLWQVRARREPMFEKAVALDIEYIEGWSIWLDIKIMLETIPAVLKGTGS